MSKSPLGAPGAMGAPEKERGACLPGDCRLVSTSPFLGRESRRQAVPLPAAVRHGQAGAGNPFRRPGDAILPDEIRVPASARRDGSISDTPGRILGNRCPLRDGGRVLSHLQELPLASPGSRRALGQTGACGQLGSRTANRMAVPSSPSIRERACPARQGPERITRQHGKGGVNGRLLRDRLGRRPP
jgi:hypothetical protein